MKYKWFTATFLSLCLIPAVGMLVLPEQQAAGNEHLTPKPSLWNAQTGWNEDFLGVAGAAFSLGAMMVLQKTGKFSIIGVSTAGGIFHNLGQVIVASLVVENIKIMLYLPILAVAGTGTGILIGITAIFTLRHLKRLPIYRRMQEENQALN